MNTLVVVTHPKDWPLKIQNVEVVPARSYLMDSQFDLMRRAKVFNLCRHYKYQSFGYYVSLLAEARGHKSIPTVMTMQDIRTPAMVRIASDDLMDKIQKSLAKIQSKKFILSIYFGQNVAKRHVRLATALFKQFPAPFLQATFVRNHQWELHNITAIPFSAIPDEHKDFVYAAAESFFSRGSLRFANRLNHTRFDLAILWDPTDITCPSDRVAIEHFTKAATELGFAVEVISKEDYGRLAEFDGLFIRATTAVNHYTYRFSRRAQAEGLIVIDDPISILRCTNKVYLADLLQHNGISTPRTQILHKGNIRTVIEEIGFPSILKQPDSSSSQGVEKANNREEFLTITSRLLKLSDLLIVQEFLPTDFDWRIGVLNHEPLYASKYYMAEHHWQIVKHDNASGNTDYGLFETIPVEDVPREGLKLALKAANLIGDGLYGVDLKQIGKKWYVIEVNDNPSIDSEVEDLVLKEGLYQQVMSVFLHRIELQKKVRAL